MANNTGFVNSASVNHTMGSVSICHTLEPFLDLQARENLPKFYVITAITSCMLNAVTCCTTLLLNAIVVVAIWRTPSLHREPKNILLCSLAVSDFLVGFSSQPSFLIAETFLIFGQRERYCYAVFVHFYTSWLFSGVSFLTLSAISIERYLALRFHLRYTELITKNRVVITVIIYWLMWVTWTTILWFAVRNRLLSYALVVLLILIAIVDGLCYFAIFKTVKRHNSQIERSQLHDQQDMARYRRTTTTMTLLVCAFAGSYLPFVVTTGISASQGKEDMRTSAAHSAAVAFVFANSTVNPLIYFWRVSEFREAAKHTLRKLHLMKPRNRVATELDTRL